MAGKVHLDILNYACGAGIKILSNRHAGEGANCIDVLTYAKAVYRQIPCILQQVGYNYCRCG